MNFNSNFRTPPTECKQSVVFGGETYFGRHFSLFILPHLISTVRSSKKCHLEVAAETFVTIIIAIARTSTKTKRLNWTIRLLSNFRAIALNWTISMIDMSVLSKQVAILRSNRRESYFFCTTLTQGNDCYIGRKNKI